MERLLNKKELEQQIEAKKADIDARIDALKHEVEEAGQDARRYIIRKPLYVAGGVLAAGLVIALLVSGAKRRKGRRQLKRSHRAIIDRYVDALVQDVRFRMTHGADGESAVRSAMESRTPLIIVENEAAEGSRGIFRDTADFALKTALGFAGKVLIDRITEKVDLEGQVDRLVESILPEDAALNGSENAVKAAE
ncbi:MAG: hypothetical protein ACOCSK_01095 [Rhodothermales bacterium]